MKKVVSGGPANRMALQGPFRPFGYNLVELSRFVVGAFPLVFSIAYPARSRRVFADPDPQRKRFRT
jgi:hypothetical protein